MRPFPWGAALVAAMLASQPATARAQALDAGVVALAADHFLISNGLFGFGARASFALGTTVSLRIGAEHTTGEAHRAGILCAGLVMPGTCLSAEPVQDDGRLTMVSGGFEARMFGSSSRNIAATVDLRVGQVRVDSRGASTGTVFSDDRSLVGGEIGVQALWSVTPNSPFSLEIAGSVGEMRSTVQEAIVDGYTPFMAGFNVRRLSVGGRWRAR
ncbi:MAG: hypothetical protein ABIY52_10105 [Gemmatimonadaceae bacterium]